MKTKYFQVDYGKYGQIVNAYEVFDLSVQSVDVKHLITLKGKRLPRVGEKIHVYKNGADQIAEVSEVHPNGIPLRAKLDENTTIELVGSIIKLVNLINRILILLGLKKNKPWKPAPNVASFRMNPIL